MTLRKIEAFLKETGMAWTLFGRLCVHDPRLVADMRNGRSPRPQTILRIEQFIQSYQEKTHAL